MTRSLVLLPLLCLAAAPTGTVVLTVVGPDGRPAAGAAVHVAEVGRTHFPDDPAPPPAAVTADAAGVARLPWPAGATRLAVSAAGVGYGWTGQLEVVANESVDAPLPPLAAYATVAGTVPPGAAATAVTLGWVYGQAPVTVPVDAAGHFTAAVPGGSWWVDASAGDRRVARVPRPVHVDNGRHLAGVDPVPLTPVQRHEWNDRRGIALQPPAEATITWATGTVRDARGRPVAGATVYAAATFHGGLRMYEQAAKATTDAAGRYAIRGAGGLSMFSATLLAAAPGHPPAFDAVTLPGPGYAEVPAGATRPTTAFATPPAPVRDFVLADRGGALDVTVTVDGRPAAAATVGLWRTGGNLRDAWAAPTGGPDQAAAERLAYPQATAGPDGVARFADLVPGTYQVVATVAGGRQTVGGLHQNWSPSADPQPYAIADGVAVRTGETARQTMAAFPQPAAAAVRFLRADGATPITDRPAFQWGPAVGGGGWSSSLTPGPDGVTHPAFGSPGLWRVSAQYHHGPTTVVPLTPPFFAADAVVAASSLLAVRDPVTVTALWQEPAVVDVDVRDAAGRPAAATVTVGPGVGDPFEIATTPAGHVQLRGVRQWHDDRVTAQLSDQPLPDLGDDAGGRTTGPLPADADLRGHTFVPAVPVDARPLDHLHLTLTAVPAGYVRGRLVAPAGHAAADYAIYMADADARGAAVALDTATGEFVAGPFVGGPIHLRVGTYGGWSGGPLLERTIPVRGGDVVTADLTPPPPPPRGDAAGGQVLISAGGAQRSPADTSDVWAGRTVVQADGTTPAYGAEVMLVEPGRAEPTAVAGSDAAGRLHGRNGWQSAMAQPADAAGSPAGPALVAWLPGAVGATVVPPAAAANPLVLPPAVSVRGTVTVGGRPPAGLHGRVRVVAAHRGLGKLDPWLSVSATPQDDGSFDLPGLSPGGYVVQAAVDGIWLSASQPLTVAAAAAPAAVALDVPPPGGPVAVRVTDAAGRPVPHAAVVVDRPPGPLTDANWPADGFATDGAGVAVVPALEAGPHAARVAGRPVTVTAPALPCDGPAAVDVRLP